MTQAVCHYCKNKLERIFICGECHSSISYCSIQCQRDDWEAHKQYCPALKKITPRYEGITTVRIISSYLKNSELPGWLRICLNKIHYKRKLIENNLMSKNCEKRLSNWNLFIKYNLENACKEFQTRDFKIIMPVLSKRFKSATKKSKEPQK